VVLKPAYSTKKCKKRYFLKKNNEKMLKKIVFIQQKRKFGHPDLGHGFFTITKIKKE